MAKSKSNILLDKLPEYAVYKGKKVRVKTDFRNWMRFGMIVSDRDIPEKKKLVEIVKCVVDETTLSMTCPELLGALFEFYSGQAPSSEDDGKQKKGAEKKPKKAALYDFCEDAEYIFASFLQVYGIDLTSAEMHWHKFRALFRSLPEDCKFSKIIGYRSCDTSKMSGEEKRFYLEMKKLYALPDKRSKEEKDADIYAELSAIIF